MWPASAPPWNRIVEDPPPLSPIARTIRPVVALGALHIWTSRFIDSSMRAPIRKTKEAGVGAGVEVGAEDGLPNAAHHLLHLVERGKERGKGEGSDHFPWAL